VEIKKKRHPIGRLRKYFEFFASVW